MRFDNNLLIKFIKDNNIQLLENYTTQRVNRNTIIFGKCITINCIYNFSKVFRQLYKSNGYCKICTSKIKGSKITIASKEKNKTILFENSLASHNKATYFSDKNIDENGDLYNINHIPLGTHDKYTFNCDMCQHDFPISIEKLSIGRWCPYCCNPPKKLCGNLHCISCFDKSASSEKRIVSCWSNKNELTPEFVFKMGDTFIYLNCDKCNHTFNPQIKTITKGAWCAYCSGHKMCFEKDCIDCFNKSFASHPKVKYWSNKNENILPRHLFKSCITSCWFECEKNHSFKNSLNSINQGRWCPHCINKTEQILYDQLSPFYISLQKQFKVEWCKNITYLPFDFVLEEYKLIIEFLSHV
jgi:hypothetical protein